MQTTAAKTIAENHNAPARGARPSAGADPICDTGQVHRQGLAGGVLRPNAPTLAPNTKTARAIRATL